MSFIKFEGVFRNSHQALISDGTFWPISIALEIFNRVRRTDKRGQHSTAPSPTPTKPRGLSAHELLVTNNSGLGIFRCSGQLAMSMTTHGRVCRVGILLASHCRHAPERIPQVHNQVDPSHFLTRVKWMSPNSPYLGHCGVTSQPLCRHRVRGQHHSQVGVPS
ncbi:hypothetical protein QR685DRAFT_110554 [Neurospora intermedia]|uniref:Uncharacterized protein n=1 Tax=Neurospora intermedia TaxID=5142 RepID=A0ABR3D119_NEUIN